MKKKNQFWTIVYTHKYGVDTWIEVAPTWEEAHILAEGGIQTSLGEPFDPENEDLEVRPFNPPHGYKLVQSK
jgi:hypothetical protein